MRECFHLDLYLLSNIWIPRFHIFVTVSWAPLISFCYVRTNPYPSSVIQFLMKFFCFLKLEFCEEIVRIRFPYLLDDKYVPVRVRVRTSAYLRGTANGSDSISGRIDKLIFTRWCIYLLLIIISFSFNNFRD